MKIAHGQVWLVELDPTQANEQAGTRPCIVLSADRFNSLPIRHGIIVPLTTRRRDLPQHIAVIDDGGLDRPSWAMCEAVRSLSVRRFKQLIGTASPEMVDVVGQWLKLWMDFP